MRKLRIVIWGGLGDCLLHTPFIRHFRRSGEYDHITCMTQKSATEMFDHSPHIDDLIGCEGPDLAVWAAPEADWDVFAPYIESQVIPSHDGGIVFRRRLGWTGVPSKDGASIVSQVAQRHGLRLADESPEIFTAPEDEQWADEFVTSLRHPVIVLNRRTAATFKEYPVPLWQSVANNLTGVGTLLEFAAPAEALNGVGCIWPFFTLRRTAALFRRVRCVVTVDSFSAHLAAAVGTPAVVLFGPSSPSVFGQPCNRNVRVGTCQPCFDPNKVGCQRPVCMSQIAPSMVVDAVRAVLSGAPS